MHWKRKNKAIETQTIIPDIYFEVYTTRVPAALFRGRNILGQNSRFAQQRRAIVDAQHFSPQMNTNVARLFSVGEARGKKWSTFFL